MVYKGKKSDLRNIKKRVFDIIQIGNKTDIPSCVFDIFISFTIILNLAVTLMLTFDEAKSYENILYVIELVTLLIFSVEYILRIWTSEYLYPLMSRKKAVVKYIFSFYGLVDFFTIIPYFIPIMFQTGAVALRIFRVIRIFRLFKINSQYDAFNVIIDVINEKKNQILSSVCMILIFMMASSLCMYSVEHEAQPEVFCNAFSGIWWAVSTLLTVGYGDIYPITVAGRLIAIIIAFLGVGMVAIPTGIISAGFMEKYTDMKTKLYLQEEKNIRYITAKVEKDHDWCGKKIREIILPPKTLLIMILRDNDEKEPTPDTVLLDGDFVVLSSPKNIVEQKLEIEEINIKKQNTWIGMKIKDLDISRQEYIVQITRKGKMFVPDENTVIKSGDRVLLYSRTMK